MRPGRSIAVAATLCIAATSAAVFLPFVPLGYHSPELQVFFETSGGLVKLLAAYLVFGRLRRTASLNDAALVFALVVMGATSVIIAALPGTAMATEHSFLAWAPIGTHMVGAMVFAASAALPDRFLARPPAAPTILTAALASVSLSTVVIGILAPFLPVGVDPSGIAGSDLREIWFSAAPSQHVVQYLVMMAYVIATFGFANRAIEKKDEMMLWLATGCTFLAFARLNYFLFPSILTTWIYVGDVIRYVGHIVILYGAGKEIRAYWRTAAVNAVADERRRMARDLHDGLAQELTFIWRESRKLAGAADGPAVPMIASAAERALAESRQAIAALTRPEDEPLATSIANAAAHVADRSGIHVKLKLDQNIMVDGETREAFLRIVGEAVTNAAKHSGAGEVRVTLEAADGVRLEISDEGRGFDPTGVDKGYTFGLVSMRERAENLGARIDFRSRPGAGTTVELTLPYQISADGRVALRRARGRPD